jgi:predicted MPP superfamily phosphohydrolase
MKLSDCEPAERHALTLLGARIGRTHLRQRLGIEGDHEAQIVRKGTHFFHLENWSAAHLLIRTLLTAVGLHGRGRRNALNIRTQHNDIHLESLPQAFDGYTILHLSDLHLDSSKEYADRLMDCVRGLRYDICVMTGDFRFLTHGPYAPTIEALTRLRPLLGDSVYAVLGNHDTIRMVPGMEAMGIRVLMNESVRIDREGAALTIVGIDDAHYYGTHNLQKAAADVTVGACSILLSHTPEPYRHAAHDDYSVMLCGHTHGGQICLPGGVPIITDSDAPRAMARGAWRYHAMLGYTSVGCGVSIVDVRLNCPPEITLHHLKCSQKTEPAGGVPTEELA